MKGVCPSFWDNACRLLFPLLLHLQASAFVLNLPIQPGGVVWLPNCLFQHKLIHLVFFCQLFIIQPALIKWLFLESIRSLSSICTCNSLCLQIFSGICNLDTSFTSFSWFYSSIVTPPFTMLFQSFHLLVLCIFRLYISIYPSSISLSFSWRECFSLSACALFFFLVLSPQIYIYGFLNRNSRRPWSYARSFLFAQLLWLPFLEIWRKGKIEQQQSGRQGCFEGRPTMIRFGNISHSAVSGSSLTTSLATFQFCSLAELNEFVCFSQGNEFMEHGNLTWNCIQKGKQIRIYLVTPSINPWS